MSQGGASGSPVFPIDKNEIIGILYAGLEDHDMTLPTRDLAAHKHIHKVPTQFSFVVPAHFINKALEEAKKDPLFHLSPDTPKLKELIDQNDFEFFDPTQEKKLWNPEIITEAAKEKLKPNVKKLTKN